MKDLELAEIPEALLWAAPGILIGAVVTAVLIFILSRRRKPDFSVGFIAWLAFEFVTPVSQHILFRLKWIRLPAEGVFVFGGMFTLLAPMVGAPLLWLLFRLLKKERS